MKLQDAMSFYRAKYNIELRSNYDYGQHFVIKELAKEFED